MDKKRMKRMIGIAIPRALIITGISYNGYIRTHTFTLSGGVVKNELIQPINNKIKVSGNADIIQMVGVVILSLFVLLAVVQ